MAKQVMMIAMIAALAAGTASAGAFSSNLSGHWSTNNHGTPQNTWGVGTGAVPGVDYPWATDDSNPANDDTATILTGHTVTINAYTGWGGAGAIWPQELTIILDGGELKSYHIGGVNASPPVRSTIQVKQTSTLSNKAGGGALKINGAIQDFDGATTGNLVIGGGKSVEIGEFGKASYGFRSGFSGNWVIGDATVVCGWNADPGTGNQIFGTGDLDINGGLVQFSKNAGSVPNNVTVGASGATIKAYGTYGGISVTLDGLISGSGVLTLDVAQPTGSLTLTNSATTVAGLKVSAGVVTLQDLGGGPADWDLSSTALTLTSGDLAYHTSITHTTVAALTLGGTPVDNGTYDIAAGTFGALNFSDYFNGVGTVTVGAPGGAIPEPAGLGLLGLALLGVRRRRQ